MKDINFRSGKVVWNTLQYEDDTISPLKSLPSEDLLAVDYEGKFIIDVGWYRTTFAIRVVPHGIDDPWGHLLDEVFCDNYAELYIKIQETVDKWDKE